MDKNKTETQIRAYQEDSAEKINQHKIDQAKQTINQQQQAQQKSQQQGK